MNISESAKDEVTFKNIHVVDSNVSVEQLKKEDLKNKVKLLNFLTVLRFSMFLLY